MEFRGGSVALLILMESLGNSLCFILFWSENSKAVSLNMNFCQKKFLSINNFMHRENIDFNSYFQIINRPCLKAVVFTLKEDKNNVWVGCQ